MHKGIETDRINWGMNFGLCRKVSWVEKRRYDSKVDVHGVTSRRP